MRAVADARSWRYAVLALYAATAVLVTLQRGVLGPTHSTFRVFRQSFWSLLHGTNLYALYPVEVGRNPADLFKYSPTVALLFAPFAVLPYTPALLAWSLLSSLLLYRALERLLPPVAATAAAVLVYPDLLASMQACSSNAVVAALIVLSFVALEQERQLRGALAVTLGTAMKIYPLAAVTFALFHPRRRRFAFILAAVAVGALLLPLLVTTPSLLIQQYGWWRDIERFDAADLAFGLSAMRLVRDWTGGTWPNWPLQAVATAVLLLPLAVRRQCWRDPGFRIHYLASLLAYALLFNHQAERASFIVGSTGVAIWCVSPPPGTTRRVPRLMLGVLALVGLRTLPLLLVWIAMQVELVRWGRASRSTAAAASLGSPVGEAA